MGHADSHSMSQAQRLASMCSVFCHYSLVLLMIDTSVTVKVCGVTLGVNERRRLTCPSGLLNDKVSWQRQLLWQQIDIVLFIWYYDLK